MPSIRTFAQLGRMPLIDTCPAFPFDNNDGPLLGVEATPGTRIAALNRSRPSRGSPVKLRSAITPSTVVVVLSTPGTSASTVTCTDTLPTTSDRLIPIAAPGLRAIPSRTSVWNPSFSTRSVYLPVGKPTSRYSPVLSVRPPRFNPVLTFSTEISAPGTTAPLASVTVPNSIPSCVCAHADPAVSAADRKRNSTLVLFGREYVEGAIEATIIHPSIFVSVL